VVTFTAQQKVEDLFGEDRKQKNWKQFRPMKGIGIERRGLSVTGDSSAQSIELARVVSNHGMDQRK